MGAAKARGLNARVAYAYDLATGYAAAEIAQRRIELAQDEVGNAEADLRVANAQVGAGKEARLRSLQAETVLRALRADLDLARASYTGALCPACQRSLALRSPIPAFPGPCWRFSIRLRRSVLSIRAVRRSIEPPSPNGRRQTSGSLHERKRAIPDVTGSLGVRQLEREGANALVVGVSVPLPLFDSNRGNIAAARAEVAGAEARAEVARTEAEAELRGAIARAEASKRVLEPRKRRSRPRRKAIALPASPTKAARRR